MPAYTRILPLAILYIVVPELTRTLYTYLPSARFPVAVDPKDKLLLGPKDLHALPLNEKTIAEFLKDSRI